MSRSDESHFDGDVIPLPPRDGFYIEDLEEMAMTDMKWLVRDYLPAGELVVLQGHGGTNKGTTAVAWAALVTRGLGECQTEPQHVLWASAEDDFGRILKPRLLAAGADISLVKPFGFRRDGVKDGLCLPDDVPELQDAIAQLGAGLVVIDPVLSHLSGKVDSYRDHDVKRSLRPLSAMAQETDCAALCLHHFGKDTTRGAYLSGQASGAFGNTARIVLAIAEDDEDDMVRVLEVVKTNVSRKVRKALRVDLVTVPPLVDPVPVIVEDGEAAKTVNELLGGRTARGAKKEDAKSVILRELEPGPQTMEYLKAKVAGETGASGDTTWRAANTLKAEGIVDRKPDGKGGKWHWFLAGSKTSASVPANPLGERSSVYVTNTEVLGVRHEVRDGTSKTSAIGERTKSGSREGTSPSKPTLVVGDDGYLELLAAAHRNGHLTEAETKQRWQLHKLVEATA